MPAGKNSQLFPLIAGFVIPAVAWVVGSLMDFDRPPPPGMIAFWFSHSILGLMCLHNRRPTSVLLAIGVGPAVAVLWILGSHHPNWPIAWHVAQIALAPGVAGPICGMLLSENSRARGEPVEPALGAQRGLLGGAAAALLISLAWIFLRHRLAEQFMESPQKIDQYLMFLYGPVAGGCLWASLRTGDSPQEPAGRP